MSFSAQPASYFQPGRIGKIMTKILITLQNSSSIVPKKFARTLSQKISRNTHIVDSGFLRLGQTRRHSSSASRGRPPPAVVTERVPVTECPFSRPSGRVQRPPRSVPVTQQLTSPIIPVFDVMSFLGSHWFWATLYFSNVLRIGVFLLLSSKIFF